MSTPAFCLSTIAASLCLALMTTNTHAEGIVIEERTLSQPAPASVTPKAAPATATTVSTPVITSGHTTPAITTDAAPETVVTSPSPTDTTPGATAEPESGNYWQLYSQLQQLQQEVALLRGTVEEQTHLIEKLQGDMRSRYTDLDQRLQQQQQEQLKQPATSATPLATDAATPLASTLEDEKKAYLAAYDTFRTGGPDKAIAPMQAFVKKYPDSSLTPGAHYWLGEFYLNARKPDPVNARKQFDTVLTKYPDNAKAPAALYKIASILDLQGKPDETRQKMLELVKRYPKSPEASLADTWLKALQAAQKPAATTRPVTKPAANKR